MFPGQTGVLANGAPAMPQSTGGVSTVRRSVTSMVDTGGTTAAASPTPSSPSKPGTYLYESGTDPETQVRMGLFGALIVRPPR